MAAGGETEPARGAKEEMTRQNAEGQQQHVIASPNPSIDDSKSVVGAGPQKVESSRVEATSVTAQAPMKPAARRKPRPRRTRPRS